MSSAGFDGQKDAILRNLKEGIDLSPKGCIDAPIADLVNCLNSLPDYCTTSSCSGRISCYRLLGERKGIDWIYVRHAEIDVQSVKKCISKLPPPTDTDDNAEGNGQQMAMLKCEGALLHILARDVDAARDLHAVAMAAGFRECGISIGPKKVILAVRTTAFGLELPIAIGNELILSERALHLTVAEANKRLRCNFARIDRLLSAIKDHFRWPLFKEISFQGNELSMNVTDRWGHVAIASRAGSAAVLGGFGIAESRSSRVTASAMIHVDSTEGAPVLSTCVGESICSDPLDLMHSAAATDGDVLVIVGGRKSPKTAMGTVLFLDRDTLQPMENHTVASECVPPRPRWGHSLTYIGHHCFLLIGGRDSECMLDDAFVLSKACGQSLTDSQVWLWHKLTPPRIDKEIRAFSRFFHASCVLDADITGHEHRLFAGDVEGAEDESLIFSRVLVHGGLVSLDESTTESSFYVANITFIPNVSVDGCPYTISVDAVPSPRLPQKNDNEEISKPRQDGVLSIDLSRFGHVLTNINYKTLVLSGGATYSSDAYSATLSEAVSLGLPCVSELDCRTGPLPVDERSFVAFDWLCNENGKVFLVHREIEWPLLSELKNVDKSACCDAFALCRCHHQCLLVNTTSFSSNFECNLLVILGGGTFCVGFSPHYCNPLAFQINWGSSLGHQDLSTAKLASPTISSSGRANAAFSGDGSQVCDLSWTLIIPKSGVKQVKNILETAGIGNKNKRISNFDAAAAEIFIYSSVSPKIGTDALIQNYFADAMALPVSQEFASFCQYGQNDLKFDAVVRQLFLVTEKFFPEEYAKILLLGRQETRSSKLDIVSGHRRAEEMLVAISRRNNIDSLEIPKKFEFVGDVLMIQEQCLLNEKWFLEFASPLDFWAKLVGLFSHLRVARKARVDPGPKRESRVELMYISPEFRSRSRRGKRPLCRNELSDGWVVVTENNIGFGFDICKVM